MPDQNESDYKPFTFADGTSSRYDSSKSMDHMMEYFPAELEKRGQGETYNAKRGASAGVRALIGGDNPQAQVATLMNKYGYVQPILYTAEQKEPMPPGAISSYGSALATIAKGGEAGGAKPERQLGPGKATEVAFLVYDKSKKEYFRVNVPGLDWGDLAGMGRGTAETIGDLLGIFGATAAQTAMGGPVGGVRGAATSIASRATGAGVGGMMGRGMYDMAADQFGREDPRPPQERIQELAGVGATHAAFEGVGEGAMRAGSGALRGLSGVTSPKKLAARKEAFSEMDEIAPGEYFTPSGLLAGPLADQKTFWGGGFTRGLEGVLYKSAWSNTKLGNKFRRITLSIDNYIKKNLDLATGTTPDKTTVIGKSMMEDIGGVSSYKPGTRKSRKAKTGGYYGAQMDRSEILYDNIRGKVGKMNLIPTEIDKYLGQWARDLRVSSTAHADEIIIGQRGLMQDIDKLLNRKKPVRYEEIDHLRQRVGSYLAEASAGSNASVDLYKKLYGNLKELQGVHLGQQMRKQLNTADAFHSAFMDDWNKVLGKISVAASTNQPWKQIQTLIRTGDDDMLGTIFKALDDDTVKKIRQRYIFEMGRKRDLSGFNEQTFVTNYHSQFSDSTKDLILPPGTALREGMDKLVAVIEHRLQKYPQKVNPLHTAQTLGGAGMGAAIGGGVGYSQGGEQRTAGDFFRGAILGAFVSIGGQIQAARLLSDPKFVKWMAHGLSDTPGSMLKNMDELSAIVASAEDIETKHAIGKYAIELATEFNRRSEMWKTQQKSMESMGMKLEGAERIDPNLLRIPGE